MTWFVVSFCMRRLIENTDHRNVIALALPSIDHLLNQEMDELYIAEVKSMTCIMQIQWELIRYIVWCIHH